MTAHVAAGEGNGGRNYGLSALYFSGPMGLGAAWQKVAKGATEADTATWQLAASYDLSSVKLFGQFSQVDNSTTGKRLPHHRPGRRGAHRGAGKVLVQLGRISPETGASRRTLSLGYDHALSKRTDLYAVLMSDRLTGLSTGSNYGLGVRHRF